MQQSQKHETFVHEYKKLQSMSLVIIVCIHKTYKIRVAFVRWYQNIVPHVIDVIGVESLFRIQGCFNTASFQSVLLYWKNRLQALHNKRAVPLKPNVTCSLKIKFRPYLVVCFCSTIVVNEDK